MKKELLQLIKGIMLGILLVAGVSFVSAAWTGPTVAPTGGNVAAPINVSASTQAKEGYITFGQVASGNATTLSPQPGPFPQSNTQNSALYVKSPSGQYDIAADIDGTLFAKGIFNSGGFLNKGSFQVNDSSGNPQFVVGSLLYTGGGARPMAGGLDPIQVLGNFDAMKDMHIVGNTYIDSMFTAHQSVVSPDIQIGAGTVGSLTLGSASSNQDHNLELNGTTNIGQGGSCDLASSSDMTKGCPMGAYLYQIDVASATGKCRYFNPDVVISSSYPNCYVQPALAVSLVATKIDESCNLTIWQFTASATGGVGDIKYAWSTVAGPISSGGGGTSKIYSFIYASGGNAIVDVTATDSKGNTAKASKNINFGNQPSSVNGVECAII